MADQAGDRQQMFVPPLPDFALPAPVMPLPPQSTSSSTSSPMSSPPMRAKQKHVNATSSTGSERAFQEKQKLKKKVPRSPSGTEVLDIIELSSDKLLSHKILELIHKKLPDWERWREVTNSDDISLERISGAMTNCIYVVHGPPVAKKSATGSTVTAERRLLLRIYGVGMEEFIERDREIFCLRRLSEQGYGPQLLATFSNGRFEEFLDCTTLTRRDIRDAQTSRGIAKQLFKLHNMVNDFPPSPKIQPSKSLSVLQGFVSPASRPDVPSSRERSEMWRVVAKYLRIALEKVPEIVEAYPEREGRAMAVDFRAGGWLQQAFNHMQQYLENLGSPIVFAHNDLQNGNILRTNDTGDLILVDYEYSAYNHRGYDIANHFIEWTSDYHGDTPHLLNQAAYPSREKQMRFIDAYMEAFEERHGPQFVQGTETAWVSIRRDVDPMTGVAPPQPPQPVTARDQARECFLVEIEKFTLASHLMWGLWGVVREGDMLGRREIAFDYWEYGMSRLEYFKANFERLMRL
ncbi:hypothetical protein RI367_000360 [Sorochytrium milnesiophthora]